MTAKKSSEPMQPPTPSAPQFSSQERSPLVSSSVGIRSMKSPSNTATLSNAIPPQERNIDGLREKIPPSKMSLSGSSDEEQMVQILTALRKIHFPKTDS